jgi:predicted aspartyl protease
MHEFWLVGLVLLGGTLEPPVMAARPALPLKLYGGCTIVVQGSIGRLQKRNFIIDTGAVPTVVDQRVAHALHLSGSSELLTVFSRQVTSERVMLPDLRLGPIHTTNLRAFVEDLSFADKALGVRIDAIVGLDVIGHGGFSIDYRSRQMLFGASGLSNWVATFEAGSPQAIVEVQIDARPVRLVVDTGARYIVLFELEDHRRFAKMSDSERQTVSDLGGNSQLGAVRLNDVRFGGMELHNQTAYVTQSVGGGTFDFDGVLGVAVLKLQRIDFDFEHGRIGWIR